MAVVNIRKFIVLDRPFSVAKLYYGISFLFYHCFNKLYVIFVASRIKYEIKQ